MEREHFSSEQVQEIISHEWFSSYDDLCIHLDGAIQELVRIGVLEKVDIPSGVNLGRYVVEGSTGTGKSSVHEALGKMQPLANGILFGERSKRSKGKNCPTVVLIEEPPKLSVPARIHLAFGLQYDTYRNACKGELRDPFHQLLLFIISRNRQDWLLAREASRGPVDPTHFAWTKLPLLLPEEQRALFCTGANINPSEQDLHLESDPMFLSDRSFVSSMVYQGFGLACELMRVNPGLDFDLTIHQCIGLVYQVHAGLEEEGFLIHSKGIVVMVPYYDDGKPPISERPLPKLDYDQVNHEFRDRHGQPDQYSSLFTPQAELYLYCLAIDELRRRIGAPPVFVLVNDPQGGRMTISSCAVLAASAFASRAMLDESRGTEFCLAPDTSNLAGFVGFPVAQVMECAIRQDWVSRVEDRYKAILETQPELVMYRGIENPAFSHWPRMWSEYGRGWHQGWLRRSALMMG